MSLVDIDVKLVASLELEDLRQVDQTAFHRVQSFDDQQNLFPRSVSSRLTLRNDFSQQGLERFHVIVLEPSDTGARESRAESNRRVVEFIGNDQTSFTDQGRNGGRVRRETHGSNHGGFGTEESSNEFLSLDMQISGRGVMSSTSARNTVSSDRSLGSIGTPTGRRSKSEIVVGRDIQCACLGTGKLKSIVVVVRLSIEAHDRSSSNTSDGSRKASVHSLLESTGVERVEIRVECGVAVGRDEMGKGGWVEFLVEEIPNVPNNNEDEVTDVGGYEDKVGRFGLSFWVNGFRGVPLQCQQVNTSRGSITNLTGPSPVGVITVPILAVLDSLLGRDERSLEVILVYRSQFLTTRLPRSSAH